MVEKKTEAHDSEHTILAEQTLQDQGLFDTMSVQDSILFRICFADDGTHHRFKTGVDSGQVVTLLIGNTAPLSNNISTQTVC